jgi:CheY-like chemotaxis protein
MCRMARARCVGGPYIRFMAIPTVFVVLDQSDRRRAVASMLERSVAVEVVAMAGGEPALAWVEAAQPAVVVTDVDTPAGEGARLVDGLRARRQTRDVRTVAIGREPADHDAARAAGCAAFLLEPFDHVDLAQVLADCLVAPARPLHAFA